MGQVIFSQYTFKNLKDIIKKNKIKTSINFFNGVDIDSYSKIPEFKECLENKNIKNINNVDGISAAIPLSIKNLKPIKRLQGPTFTDKFLNDEELNKNKKHFFVGVEEENLNKVLKKYSKLKAQNIFGYNPPYVKGIFFSEKERKKIVNMINKSKADYLWIGMGAPKQQILTNQIYDKIKTKNIFNVGVAMEFIKGSKKRAPKFFQSIGLEWLYRLLFSQFKLTSSRMIPSFKGMIKTFFMAKVEK